LDNERVRIHITHEETIDIGPRILDLYKSPRVRSSLEKVIAEPLTRSGIEEFRTNFSDTDEQVIVRKDEKEYFEMPLLGDEILGENITDAYLQVISLSFKEDNKWRFSRGETVFYALIEDASFLDRIDKNEVRFSKDDILKVKLYTKDFLTGTGFKTEYKVLEVLEHRSAARQLRLQMEDEDDDKEGDDDEKSSA
jgi:hypothetical protein